MKSSSIRPGSLAACLLGMFILSTLPVTARARPKAAPRSPAATLYVSLIDQLGPQVGGPAFNGLDERRRGPIFGAALQDATRAGKLPPVVIVNRDLSLPLTVADEPQAPPGVRLVRIYLTQWAQTRLGGSADTEILCRFYVELLRDGRVEKKLGPFFARQTDDLVTAATPPDRWAQYQAVARTAIEQLSVALQPAG